MKARSIHFLLPKLWLYLAVVPLVIVSGGCGNAGTKYTENFNEDWQYRNAADSRMMALGTVLLNYMEYNKETLPPMHSAQAFRVALLPYLEKGMIKESEKVFYHPKTGDLFQPTASLSGRTLAQLEASGKKVFVGYTKGTETVESGVLYFDPKDSLYVRSGAASTSSLEALVRAES